LLIKKKGWIFAGDAYIGGKDRALRQDYDIWQTIKSLKKIARLNPSLLFPGSGSVRKHPRERRSWRKLNTWREWVIGF